MSNLPYRAGPTRRNVLRGGAAIGASFLAGRHAPALAQGARTLRVVTEVAVKSFDPIWHGSLVTRNYGYMVYDTLLSLDAKLQPQPQMLEGWEVSADKLVYTFRLREGLSWHDGAPVTSDDCIASIKRWGARDAMGQMMMSSLAETKRLDDRRFQLVFKEVFGLVIEALAKPSVVVPFMMPKRMAETDPYKEVVDNVGSGPFVFQKSEWRPGDRTVFVKNKSYVPRQEPSSGLAGGKVANADRVEWVELPDAQTQVNAFLNGEIDILEQIPHDMLPLVEGHKDITLVRGDYSSQFVFRPNWLHPPFNNQKVRQAAMMALDQKEIITSFGGDPKYFKTCKAFFSCGGPNASDAGAAGKIEGNAQESRQLLKEAGYDGMPVVLMQGIGRPLFENLPLVLKAQLERGGFNVKIVTAEYITVMTRAIRKEPPDQGGWNAIVHGWSEMDILDPLMNPSIQANCEKARPGWPCDPNIEQLRAGYARESDPGRRKKIAQALQAYAMEAVPYIPLGEWHGVTGLGKGVVDWLNAPVPVYWNVAKR